MSRIFLAIGCFFGFSSVALGAFAAHALRPVLGDAAFGIWQTAVHYQQVHALALLAVGLLLQRTSSPWLLRAGWAFTLGTFLFSTSLYSLALTGIKLLGAITPVGGVSFLLGWLFLGRAVWRD